MRLRRRLDLELVRRRLVSSRAEAQEAIVQGRVTVDGAPALKATTQIHRSQNVVVSGTPRLFVSRGGDKLTAALERFAVPVQGLRCLDAGASTGGFTDCLLQHGAGHVIAVDVGYGQLAERVRRDPRVTVLERTNVRNLVAEDIPGPQPDLVVADLSFISLRLALPALRRVAAPHAEAILLCKPQFEAGRELVGKGGVVRDPAVWHTTLLSVAAAADTIGWGAVDVAPSPLTGASGNVEFFLRLAPGAAGEDLDERIAAAVTDVTASQQKRVPPTFWARQDRSPTYGKRSRSR
ncbi:MAG: TlyA family RNA methyltransferase [Actinomycetota bacterium]|nr:TlyA family RNA methyltransferase [Actinomycetota bacterium]